MAKKLVFSESDSNRDVNFSLIFNSFHIGARPASREDHKSCSRILDALEAISVEAEHVVPGFAPDDSGAPRGRTLLLGNQFIVLEDHQFDFLKKSIAALSTLPCGSRNVEAMWTFLDEAKSGGAKALVEEESVQE